MDTGKKLSWKNDAGIFFLHGIFLFSKKYKEELVKTKGRDMAHIQVMHEHK